MKDFLIEHYTFLTHTVEIIAAVTGTIYVKKSRDKITRLFVYYLWLTVFVENIALYSRFMLNNYDNGLFNYIKNGPLCTNHWLYNVRSLVLIILLGKYYSKLVQKQTFKRIINALVIGFAIFFVFYFMFSSSFFNSGIQYGFMIRTVILTVFICLYFYLRSEF